MTALSAWLVFEDEAGFAMTPADHPHPVPPRPHSPRARAGALPPLQCRHDVLDSCLIGTGLLPVRP
ncbi:hypothetical protein [Streptomyces sp. SID2888]|uniref:hypothetical protein n=1 Tax=Streptomyces sp. SID2888 TaxID=2690256 RepID=UPI0023519F38|nr:hypothetical protein [Streptomyces sp. SID2888]